METHERRNFLKKVIKFFFSFISVVLLSALFYLYPTNIRKKQKRDIYLMDEDELPKRGVRKVTVQYEYNGKLINNKVFLAINRDGLTAFSPVCTHFGCLVNWDNNKKIFICPCHAGRYDINGDVISGPPPKPLTRLPLKIENGKVYVEILV